MNKKIIIYASVLAVFLMVMVPNISAVEYYSVKEVIVEKYVGFELGIDTILEKLENFLDFPSTLIVLITSILQAIFVISSYLLAQFVVANAENILIGIIFNFLSATLTGLIISKWSEYIRNNFELSTLDELILNYLPMIVYYIFAIIYIIFRFGNSSKNNTDNNKISIKPIVLNI